MQKEIHCDMLQQDSRIHILFGNVSLQQFANRLPSIALRPEVNTDIVQAFKIVHKLLVHAYFEYLFIDVAVTKALHTLEMALKIRYREINATDPNTKNDSLYKLLEWFRSNSYFERDDADFFARVKNAHNYLSHPTAFRFAGTASLQWIETTVGLVNDVYDDIHLRKQRKTLGTSFEVILNNFLKDGAKLKAGKEEILLYGQAGSIVNNKSKPITYIFALLPLFDPSSPEWKPPLLFTISDLTVFNSREVVVAFDSESTPVVLSLDLTHDERSLIQQFREHCSSKQELIMTQVAMLHDADTCLRKELDKIRMM